MVVEDPPAGGMVNGGALRSQAKPDEATQGEGGSDGVVGSMGNVQS